MTIQDLIDALKQATPDQLHDLRDLLYPSSYLDELDSGEEVRHLIDDLEADSGETRENVLLKALRLYRMGLDAAREGNHLAVLNNDDEIIREIMGFEPASSPPPTAKAG